MSAESLRQTSTPENRRQPPGLQSRVRSFLSAHDVNPGDITSEEDDRRRCAPLLVDFLYEEFLASDSRPSVTATAVKRRLKFNYDLRYHRRRDFEGAYTSFERRIVQEATQLNALVEIPEIDKPYALARALSDTELGPLAQDALVAFYNEICLGRERAITEAS